MVDGNFGFYGGLMRFAGLIYSQTLKSRTNCWNYRSYEGQSSGFSYLTFVVAILLIEDSMIAVGILNFRVMVALYSRLDC